MLFTHTHLHSAASTRDALALAPKFLFLTCLLPSTDIRALQSLSINDLIDSPSPGPGVFPLATYTDAVDNSYCPSNM